MDIPVNHLILLIGTNPLPNFVVNQHFLKHHPTIEHLWLIHSEQRGEQRGTKELAESILKVLSETGMLSAVSIHYVSLEDVSSAVHIAHNIKKKLVDKLDGDALVHLNYTGGTKAMSVHVYRALEAAFGDRCTFSYLDSREYILRGDDGARLTGDLRESISLSLDHLIKLHGYEKKKEEDNPDWPEVVDKFKLLIAQGKLDDYLTWAKGFLRSSYYDNKRKFIERKNKFITHNQIDKDPRIFKNSFSKNTPDHVLDLLKLIPSENSLLNRDGSVWIPDESVTNPVYKRRLEPAIRHFLDGKWLEAYVGRVVEEQITADATLSGKNIKLELNWKVWDGLSSKPFEIDIIVINGYQLCGISVTTSHDAGICKSKGFEVLHRVQQMGGEESKAILITCLPQDHVGAFTQDLITISGARGEKLLVLGKEDLQETRLWQKIRNHIWGR